MNRIVRAFLVLVCSSLIWPAVAQTNPPVAAAGRDATTSSNTPNATATNQSSPVVLLSEQIRTECIDGRRSICGRILRIVPDGLIIESGYTNLLRESLHTSWLVPGIAAAERTPNLIESHEPGAICVGTIYLTDLPRGNPRQYDYVVIAGYPEGQYTFTSVGNIQKTVRRFSASLEKAVRFNFEAATQTPSSPTK